MCRCERATARWRVVYGLPDGRHVSYHVCTACLSDRTREAVDNPVLQPDHIEPLS